MDVPVIMQLKLQQSLRFDNVEMPQIQLSTDCSCFQLCHRDKYALCKRCRKPRIPECSSWNARRRQALEIVQTMQKTVVPQVQFIDVGSSRCEHAAKVPAVFSAKSEVQFLPFFKCVFRTPSIWTLSPGFQRTFWRALDD